MTLDEAMKLIGGDEMPTKIELNPCPFCGDKVEIVKCEEPLVYRPTRNHPYYVECFSCKLLFGYDEDYGGVFDTKKEAAEAWNTRTPGWISCSERMPKDWAFVLICNEKNEIVTALYDHHTNRFHVRFSALSFNASEITYWMPLPEPPEKTN